MSKAKDLSATRRQKDMFRTSVMRLEDCFAALEAKDTLTGSDLSVECSLKIEALDAEFKEHHYAVIDLVGDDEQKLDEEQAVMDDHEDKVAVITECQQQLWPKSKVATSAAHSTGQSHHLHSQLNNVERNLCLVWGKLTL